MTEYTIWTALAEFGITPETVKKSVRTFIQTAIGYFAVNIAFVDFSAGKEVIKSALCGLGVSAISAGVAAVMNLEKSAEEDEPDVEEEFLESEVE